MACHWEHCTTRLISWTEDQENLVLIKKPTAKKERRTNWKNYWRNAGVHKTNNYDQKEIWVLPTKPQLQEEKVVSNERGSKAVQRNQSCNLPDKTFEDNMLRRSRPVSCTFPESKA